LADLGQALFTLDAAPEPLDAFRQSVRRALAEGLEADVLAAAVNEEVVRERT
jgi:hypothetical protein